jgi:preprotein translocase subunit SecF/SecD/SecF fusion protein
MKRLPIETNFNFMKYRYIAFALSAVALVASLILIPTRGLNFGIDFAGGLLVEITEPEGATISDIRDLARDLNLKAPNITEAIGTGPSAKETFVIRAALSEPEELASETNSEGVELQDQAQRVITAIETKFPHAEEGKRDWEILRSESVGPKVSGELLRAGVTALVVSLLFMLGYIWFRFQAQFSAGAVLALVHDVILTIGVFSILQIDFDLTTIAALLTIIGYSMNDTVVVYDRVREELRKYKKMPLKDVINLALNRTLTRTTLTSGTTLLALSAIYVLGGEVLRGFSFALIWGILVGTYSSIFVASALLLHTGLKRDPQKFDGPDEQTA